MTEEIRYIANLQKQEEFDNEVTELKDELKRLEQENKELRQQYNCYACDTCQGKEDYRNMKRHCKNAIKTVHAYRSALEEIREIEELAYYSKGILEEPLSQRDFILDAINNYEQRRIKILNKINEVLK